ncbi:glycosyl transferase family 1 [Dyadobacter beijingensis]|uniref:Glycosyl transferase family 1 n=1 Tax=Dyadobacter beijingensis TaxID=365489 RepID=A0ABQ2HPF9_9BACT|nr:glycosyltransferase family 4 protein [Dyadobacter beijingensis]GGM86322.1 glycosyl transferase family 1 [Dyadobacter beijingensis]
MKILFVINSSNNGGAIKMIVALYKEVKRHFPQSKIVFLKKIESQYSNIEGAYYLSDRLSSLPDYYKVYQRLKAVMIDEKPDALISFLPLANIFTSVIGRSLGIPYRVASQRNPPQIYGFVVRTLDRYLGARDYYTANVCNSKAGMDAFSEYPEAYKKHLSVINNCVEEPDFSISKIDAKSRIGMPLDKTILTCVGRLHDQKNHEVIVKAMKHLNDAVLYLGGDGPLRDEITKLIESEGVERKVVMLGDLDRDQVRLLLRASDVFLIPSKYEGLSNSLLEAMSYGLPVICSNIPSFTDFLKLDDRQGHAGMVIENNDDREWAKGIQRMTHSDELLEDYSRRSLDKVADLSPQKMAFRFLKLLGVQEKEYVG